MPTTREEFLDYIMAQENGYLWLCIVVHALGEANITMGPKGEHIVLSESGKALGKACYSSERGKWIGDRAVERARAAHTE